MPERTKLKLLLDLLQVLVGLVQIVTLFYTVQQVKYALQQTGAAYGQLKVAEDQLADARRQNTLVNRQEIFHADEQFLLEKVLPLWTEWQQLYVRCIRQGCGEKQAFDFLVDLQVLESKWNAVTELIPPIEGGETSISKKIDKLFASGKYSVVKGELEKFINTVVRGQKDFLSKRVRREAEDYERVRSDGPQVTQ